MESVFQEGYVGQVEGQRDRSNQRPLHPPFFCVGTGVVFGQVGTQVISDLNERGLNDV